jgi:hypothetical protein
MLRISYSDAGKEQRFSLCGRLAGPWVNEFRACWQYARKLAPLSQAVVDLSDVTFIGEDGKSLLSEMKGAGVTFVAAGVETKHLVANLKAGPRCDESAQ